MPTVPNLIGTSVSNAQAATVNAGFSGGTGTMYTSPRNGDGDTIKSQSPAAGSSQPATVDFTFTVYDIGGADPAVIWGH